MSTDCTEDQVRDIVREEIQPLDQDFRSAKKWVIGLVLSLIVGTLSVGVWVGTIEEKVNHIEDDQIRFEDKIEDKLVRIENLLLQLTKDISNSN